ncbi:hypothetical protein [Bradyrhizobium sp. RT3b]|uniref:hypothetical protein n=1 Tax=Bradyrhizobium sp. RT3b TaxID=3156334 RepID=UPI003392A873
MAKPSRASARGREALLAKARRRRSGGDAAKAAIDLNLKESLVVRDSSASNHLRGCGVAVRSGSGRGSFHLVLAVAAVDHVHDHVVQAKGAFDETILGILKLKDRGQRVEKGHHGVAVGHSGKLTGRCCHLAAMGHCMTLPLYGTASQSDGFSSNKARSALRLRSIDSNAERHVADFALARTPDEVQLAIEADWPSILVISDRPIDLFGTFRGRLVAVPPKYDYLADGDIIGFDHVSRKFRTLYRRNSAHNSFLVTERCNNYCLMCSQPPKDVDDRWILSEIKESLPLVDPATRALTFTGGETLSDWEDFVTVLKECRDRLPATAIQVLTNGRAFADSRIVDAWKEIDHPNLMAAIPVYGLSVGGPRLLFKRFASSTKLDGLPRR